MLTTSKNASCSQEPSDAIKIFGGGESLTSDLTFCMKSRECNNTNKPHKARVTTM